MSEKFSIGSTPWLKRFSASVTTSTFPVRSPLPNSRALDAVGAGHHAELGGGHRGATVVVGVQREHDRVAGADVAMEHSIWSP